MTNYGMIVGQARRSVGWRGVGAGQQPPVEKGVGGLADLEGSRKVPPGDAEPRNLLLKGPARMVRDYRTRLLPGQKLEYVHHRDFDEPGAEERFLAPVPAPSAEAILGSPPRAGRSADVSFDCRSAPLLRPEEEVQLFLRMNYLKYRASKLREALVPSLALASELAELERLLREALAVKDHIVLANLRLVVSIARKRVQPGRSFADLLSEGNLILVRAVEKFDVSRGFRFSTYASCAIMRDLARATGRENDRLHRFWTGYQELLDESAGRVADDREDEPDEHGNAEVVVRMLAVLGERERTIIVNYFGLGGGRARTYRELGKELGITKERVRQIEARAREKLREFAREQGLDPTAA